MSQSAEIPKRDWSISFLNIVEKIQTTNTNPLFFMVNMIEI